MQKDILTVQDRDDIQKIILEYQHDIAQIGNREVRRTKNGKRLVALAEVKRSLALLEIAQRSHKDPDDMMNAKIEES